mgnify:CR=1 FL=1
MELVMIILALGAGIALGMYISSQIEKSIDRNIEDLHTDLTLNLEDWKIAIEQKYKDKYKCKCKCKK